MSRASMVVGRAALSRDTRELHLVLPVLREWRAHAVVAGATALLLLLCLLLRLLGVLLRLLLRRRAHVVRCSGGSGSCSLLVLLLLVLVVRKGLCVVHSCAMGPAIEAGQRGWVGRRTAPGCSCGGCSCCGGGKVVVGGRAGRRTKR